MIKSYKLPEWIKTSDGRVLNIDEFIEEMDNDLVQKAFYKQLKSGKVELGFRPIVLALAKNAIQFKENNKPYFDKLVSQAIHLGTVMI